MSEKVGGLLAYLDRLAALEATGIRCTREISECVNALRFELGLGLSTKFNRESTWNIVQAAKEEGDQHKDLDTFIVRNNESVDDKITELRARGYRIFYLARGVGVVDDFIGGDS